MYNRKRTIKQILGGTLLALSMVLPIISTEANAFDSKIVYDQHSNKLLLESNYEPEPDEVISNFDQLRYGEYNIKAWTNSDDLGFHQKHRSYGNSCVGQCLNELLDKADIQVNVFKKNGYTPKYTPLQIMGQDPTKWGCFQLCSHSKTLDNDYKLGNIRDGILTIPKNDFDDDKLDRVILTPDHGVDHDAYLRSYFTDGPNAQLNYNNWIKLDINRPVNFSFKSKGTGTIAANAPLGNKLTKPYFRMGELNVTCIFNSDDNINIHNVGNMAADNLNADIGGSPDMVGRFQGFKCILKVCQDEHCISQRDLTNDDRTKLYNWRYSNPSTRPFTIAMTKGENYPSSYYNSNSVRQTVFGNIYPSYRLSYNNVDELFIYPHNIYYKSWSPMYGEVNWPTRPFTEFSINDHYLHIKKSELYNFNFSSSTNFSEMRAMFQEEHYNIHSSRNKLIVSSDEFKPGNILINMSKNPKILDDENSWRRFELNASYVSSELKLKDMVISYAKKIRHYFCSNTNSCRLIQKEPYSNTSTIKSNEGYRLKRLRKDEKYLIVGNNKYNLLYDYDFNGFYKAELIGDNDEVLDTNIVNVSNVPKPKLNLDCDVSHNGRIKYSIEYNNGYNLDLAEAADIRRDHTYNFTCNILDLEGNKFDEFSVTYNKYNIIDNTHVSLQDGNLNIAVPIMFDDSSHTTLFPVDSELNGMSHFGNYSYSNYKCDNCGVKGTKGLYIPPNYVEGRTSCSTVTISGYTNPITGDNPKYNHGALLGMWAKGDGWIGAHNEHDGLYSMMPFSGYVNSKTWVPLQNYASYARLDNTLTLSFCNSKTGLYIDDIYFSNVVPTIITINGSIHPSPGLNGVTGVPGYDPNANNRPWLSSIIKSNLVQIVYNKPTGSNVEVGVDSLYAKPRYQKFNLSDVGDIEFLDIIPNKPGKPGCQSLGRESIVNSIYEIPEDYFICNDLDYATITGVYDGDKKTDPIEIRNPYRTATIVDDLKLEVARQYVYAALPVKYRFGLTSTLLLAFDEYIDGAKTHAYVQPGSGYEICDDCGINGTKAIRFKKKAYGCTTVKIEDLLPSHIPSKYSLSGFLAGFSVKGHGTVSLNGRWSTGSNMPIAHLYANHTEWKTYTDYKNHFTKVSGSLYLSACDVHEDIIIDNLFVTEKHEDYTAKFAGEKIDWIPSAVDPRVDYNPYKMEYISTQDLDDSSFKVKLINKADPRVKYSLEYPLSISKYKEVWLGQELTLVDFRLFRNSDSIFSKCGKPTIGNNAIALNKDWLECTEEDNICTKGIYINQDNDQYETGFSCFLNPYAKTKLDVNVTLENGDEFMSLKSQKFKVKVNGVDFGRVTAHEDIYHLEGKVPNQATLAKPQGYKVTFEPLSEDYVFEQVEPQKTMPQYDPMTRKFTYNLKLKLKPTRQVKGQIRLHLTSIPNGISKQVKARYGGSEEFTVNITGSNPLDMNVNKNGFAFKSVSSENRHTIDTVIKPVLFKMSERGAVAAKDKLIVTSPGLQFDCDEINHIYSREDLSYDGWKPEFLDMEAYCSIIVGQSKYSFDHPSRVALDTQEHLYIDIEPKLYENQYLQTFLKTSRGWITANEMSVSNLGMIQLDPTYWDIINAEQNRRHPYILVETNKQKILSKLSNTDVQSNFMALIQDDAKIPTVKVNDLRMQIQGLELPGGAYPMLNVVERDVKSGKERVVASVPADKTKTIDWINEAKSQTGTFLSDAIVGSYYKDKGPLGRKYSTKEYWVTLTGLGRAKIKGLPNYKGGKLFRLSIEDILIPQTGPRTHVTPSGAELMEAIVKESKTAQECLQSGPKMVECVMDESKFPVIDEDSWQYSLEKGLECMKKNGGIPCGKHATGPLNPNGPVRPGTNPDKTEPIKNGDKDDNKVGCPGNPGCPGYIYVPDAPLVPGLPPPTVIHPLVLEVEPKEGTISTQIINRLPKRGMLKGKLELRRTGPAGTEVIESITIDQNKVLHGKKVILEDINGNKYTYEWAFTPDDDDLDIRVSYPNNGSVIVEYAPTYKDYSIRIDKKPGEFLDRPYKVVVKAGNKIVSKEVRNPNDSQVLKFERMPVNDVNGNKNKVEVYMEQGQDYYKLEAIAPINRKVANGTYRISKKGQDKTEVTLDIPWDSPIKVPQGLPRCMIDIKTNEKFQILDPPSWTKTRDGSYRWSGKAYFPFSKYRQDGTLRVLKFCPGDPGLDIWSETIEIPLVCARTTNPCPLPIPIKPEDPSNPNKTIAEVNWLGDAIGGTNKGIVTVTNNNVTVKSEEIYPQENRKQHIVKVPENVRNSSSIDVDYRQDVDSNYEILKHRRQDGIFQFDLKQRKTIAGKVIWPGDIPASDIINKPITIEYIEESPSNKCSLTSIEQNGVRKAPPIVLRTCPNNLVSQTLTKKSGTIGADGSYSFTDIDTTNGYNVSIGLDNDKYDARVDDQGNITIYKKDSKKEWSIVLIDEKSGHPALIEDVQFKLKHTSGKTMTISTNKYGVASFDYRLFPNSGKISVQRVSKHVDLDIRIERGREEFILGQGGIKSLRYLVTR